MDDLKKADVQWNRFGENSNGLFGSNFEDGGERLATVTCPSCGNRTALEYHEYMYFLSKESIDCRSCLNPYTLKTFTRKNNDEKKVHKKIKKLRDGSGKKDALGRGDWGEA